MFLCLFVSIGGLVWNSRNLSITTEEQKKAKERVRENECGRAWKLMEQSFRVGRRSSSWEAKVSCRGGRCCNMREVCC